MNQKIEFKYVFKEDYSPIYVNGVYGGVGPQGEIVMNFFLERQPVPRDEFYKISEVDQPLIKEGSNIEDSRNLFIRHVQSGVILDIQHAIVLNTWLTSIIEQYKHLREIDKKEGK